MAFVVKVRREVFGSAGTKDIVNSARTKSRVSWPPVLTCPACGNQDRFIEIMDTEVHLVDGSRTHIRLIEGVTDHFLCYECGESFDPDSK
jgi:hypothetical protein